MDPHWGLAVLVGVCLLQLPAVLLLARRVELAEELPWRAGYAAGVRSGGPVGDPAVPAAGVCPRCGSENAPGFTFCRACITRL